MDKSKSEYMKDKENKKPGDKYLRQIDYLMD